MTKNIFEGAKFGDKFLTRDGRKACFHSLYQNRRVWCMVENEPQDVPYSLNGESQGDNCFDIVSRYQEPNDKAKLSYCHTCCNHRTYKDCECVCANFRNFCKAMEG